MQLRSYASCLCLLACAWFARPASAHSMYQAAIMLDFRGNNVDVELQLPVERMETALGTTLSAESLVQQRSRISGYIISRISATLPDGRKLSIHEVSPPALSDIDGAPYVTEILRLAPPANASPDLFDLRSEILIDSIPTQVALVVIRSDWRTSTFANDPKLLGIVKSSNRSITIDRRDGSWWNGFDSVFRLGMRHIAEGTDHLLFLLSLLLPAPLLARRSRWAGHAGIRQCLWKIAKIVTAFTVGHSITLAAGALDVVHIPSRPIEVLIAASILVSAAHALRPIFPGREAVISGCFGLVHGLAFATTLAELGLGRWERVASILGFNLGIEAMQLVVVAAAMPSLVLLSRTQLYGWVRIPGALFAGIAAAGWIAERLWNLPNPVDGIVVALAQRALWIAAGLTLLGAAAGSWSKLRSEPASE